MEKKKRQRARKEMAREGKRESTSILTGETSTTRKGQPGEWGKKVGGGILSLKD